MTAKDGGHAGETTLAEIDALLRAHVLLPEERIVWRGRPSPRAAIRGRLLLNLAIALPFLVLVAFMGARAGFGPQTAIYAVLFGLGVWQLSRPWRFYRRAARTLYAVTDRRVLIVSSDRPAAVHSIAPERIRQVLLHRFGDGSGHLYFQLSGAGRLQVRYDRVGFMDGFWGIDDPAGAAEAAQSLIGRPIDPT